MVQAFIPVYSLLKIPALKEPHLALIAPNNSPEASLEEFLTFEVE